MQLPDLKVPPFNTTLLGVIRGVADYFSLPWSDAMLYGLSGQAFMINIHETLCPSGPYCWNRQPFYPLLGNLGVTMSESDFCSDQTPESERMRIEADLVSRLGQGQPCGLLNLEFQLITGYDDTGFLTTQPWLPHVDFPPGHLTFGRWHELGADTPVQFFTFARSGMADEREAVLAGLRYAADINDRPQRHTQPPYATGLSAYDAWISAIQAGHGISHGNWWNASVWAECRHFAAAYMTELAGKYPDLADLAEPMAEDYRALSGLLIKTADKEADQQAKVHWLEDARAAEARCTGMIRTLISRLEA